MVKFVKLIDFMTLQGLYIKEDLSRNLIISLKLIFIKIEKKLNFHEAKFNFNKYF